MIQDPTTGTMTYVGEVVFAKVEGTKISVLVMSQETGISETILVPLNNKVVVDCPVCIVNDYLQKQILVERDRPRLEKLKADAITTLVWSKCPVVVTYRNETKRGTFLGYIRSCPPPDDVCVVKLDDGSQCYPRPKDVEFLAETDDQKNAVNIFLNKDN